jgi:predicted DNA-binding protein (MmcQ/YjbR family)
MNLDTVRAFCLSLPHATEGVQWDNDLLFRIGGKMFTIMALEPNARYRVSFKTTPEEFAELVEHPGIDPAPYAARYHWVSLERFDSLPWGELKERIRASYDLVWNCLTKKARTELSNQPVRPAKRRPVAKGKARKSKPRRSRR